MSAARVHNTCNRDARVLEAVHAVAAYGRVTLAALVGYLRKTDTERDIDRALQRLRKRKVIAWASAKEGWKFVASVTQ
jgi:hypothetical protein